MILSDTTKQLVAQALSLDPSDVSASTALGSTDQWDSLAHMRLILGIEQHLGTVLGPDAIVQIMSAIDVEAVLEDAATA